MVKADLGIKRVCPSCGARFYDLQKRPIECPKCQFSFEPESLYKQRRPRTPEPAVTIVAPEQEDEEAEEHEQEDAELEEAAVETEAPNVAATGEDENEDEETPDTETEAEDAGMSVVDADTADIEEVEDEDLGDDDDEEDDSLLEEEEDSNDDVSGIIDADIEKDER